MWLELAAADVPGGASDSLIAVIGGIVVAALGTLGVVLREVIIGRNSRRNPQSPASTTIVDVVALAADVAVLKDWRQETRKADDIHDRRVDALEDDVEDLVRWHDREHPDWRP